MKRDNEGWEIWLHVVTPIFLVVVVVVWGVMSENKRLEYEQQLARCKTLQGEYGGGKCFKGGKEI